MSSRAALLLLLTLAAPLPADVIILPANPDTPRLVDPLDPAAPRDFVLPVVTRSFQSDQLPKTPIASLIADLRSPDFARRDHASDALLHLPADRLSDITAALDKESDPEALNRLTAIAAHLFLKARTPLDGTTALLGVQFRAELTRPDPKHPDDFRMSIRVVNTQPGYPAHQDLHPGDRILAIDGRRLSLTMQDTDFVRMVREHAPGTSMALELLRGNQLLTLDLQLAALPNNVADNVSSAILQRDQALKLFLSRLPTANEPALVVKDTSNPDDTPNEIRTLPDGSILILPHR